MQAARLPVADDVRTHDLDLAQAPVFQRARTATAPILEVSLVDLTTFNALMAVAVPVRDAAGRRDGVVVINLLLDDLSTLLRTVVDEQQHQGHPVMISMINEQGHLIATPERERLAQPALNELPGASDALAWNMPCSTNAATNGCAKLPRIMNTSTGAPWRRSKRWPRSWAT